MTKEPITCEFLEKLKTQGGNMFIGSPRLGDEEDNNLLFFVIPGQTFPVRMITRKEFIKDMDADIDKKHRAFMAMNDEEKVIYALTNDFIMGLFKEYDLPLE